MWDLLELSSPVLADEFFTTEPPRKLCGRHLMSSFSPIILIATVIILTLIFLMALGITLHPHSASSLSSPLPPSPPSSLASIDGLHHRHPYLAHPSLCRHLPCLHLQHHCHPPCHRPLPHLSPSAGVAFSLWFPAPLPVLLLMASELPLDCLFPTPALLPGFDLVLWLHLPALGLL